MLGAAGRAREQEVATRVRNAGAVLLGPNCLGVFDASAELDVGWSELPRGSIGLVSQSGNLALELGLLFAEVGLGFSRFASLGNQADLETADVVRGGPIVSTTSASSGVRTRCTASRSGGAPAPGTTISST